MNSNNLISIIVLNYNGVNYLQKTLPAIINQTFNNFEIIIVDNNSEDNSVEYIKDFQQKYSNIHLIKNPSNLGYSAGKNIGVKKARGDYILLLDEDILLENTNTLELLLENYADDSLVSIVLVDADKQETKYYGGYFNLVYRVNTKFKSYIELNSLQRFYAGYYNGAFLFTKKSIWKKLEGFDENQPFNLDDSDLGVRAWVYGFKVEILSLVKAQHLGVYSTPKSNRQGLTWKYQYFFSGYARMICKNYKLKNLLIALPLFTIVTIIKTIWLTFKNLNPGYCFSFGKSILIFLKNLVNTLQERSKIQYNRRQEDIFLTIKPPFN